MFKIQNSPIVDYDYDDVVGRSVYGMRIHPVFKVPKMHWGIDIIVPKMTPIRAMADGTVTISKMQNNRKGYGNYVVIKHSDGYSLYCHMERRIVDVGDKVSAGDVIGFVGSTGDSTGYHVHVGICKNFYAGTDESREWADPLPAIKEAVKMAASTTTPKTHWAKKYLDNLVRKGIIQNPQNHENTLNENITKGEVFALLDRATDK